MKTDVSFVILTYNDADMAINAIKSIKKLKTKYKYDILIVDNASRDNTPGRIRKTFRDVAVIGLPKNIGTSAYDAAIKKSKSRYIYFTGCDIEVKEDMLDRLVDFLDKNSNAAQAAPKYINFHNRKETDMAGTWLSKSFYSGTFKDETLGNKPVEVPYIGTGLIRSGIVDKFGYLFDNDYFFYGEDVDLGLRLRLLGYKIYYIPDSIVYHIGSVSREIHKRSNLVFLMERNLLTTFLKILSLKSIIMLMPYALAMRFAAIARDILFLRFADSFSRLKAIFWILFNINKIMEKREKIQKIRVVDDKILFRIFSEKHLI